ncbi:flippase-like domain-containing protein [Candidatus Roizmanbacteria bacterium]|nr:flippase-like domain-containing protein [Candidatus Roizmanbacteria bacterium]
MRKILLILFFFVSLGIAIISMGELKNTWRTLKHGDIRFILLAILLLIFWTLNEAAGYRSLYQLMDVKEKFKHLVLLSSASSFINVVAPSGGFGGVAVFVDDAGKRGNPRGLAAAVGALYLFLEYSAFMIILGMGWVVFIRRNDLKPGEITASFIMLGIVVSMGILIYIGSHSNEKLGRILGWLAHRINQILWIFLHREYFHEIAAHEFGVEVADGLSILRTKHRGIVIPFLFALNSKFLQTLILGMTFLAFDVPFSIGTIVAGFASAYLFLIVSPTPYGIGIVETLLPLALTSLSVAWEDSVIITLMYRGITFWIPLVVGGISFRLLQNE